MSQNSKIGYVIVNFGGPRSRKEVNPFLRALLTDQDVVRTPLPSWLHNYLFTKIADRRCEKVANDYDLIGGRSPIFEDTEAVAEELRKKIPYPVFTFHRYLPETHLSFLQKLEESDFEEIRVFPMFPQFSFATSGSIARFFETKLSSATLQKISWIRSYPEDEDYIRAMTSTIKDFLRDSQFEESKTFLIFSAHGLPQSFINNGDVYQKECTLSYEKIVQNFPSALHQLTYQSKFGFGKWLEPSTQKFCENISKYIQNKENVVIVPLSFTSDHIETLFEIESQYIPLLKSRSLCAKRCPALNRRFDWIEAIAKMCASSFLTPNKDLIWKKTF